jgi:hypothetical protein
MKIDLMEICECVVDWACRETLGISYVETLGSIKVAVETRTVTRIFIPNCPMFCIYGHCYFSSAEGIEIFSIVSNHCNARDLTTRTKVTDLGVCVCVCVSCLYTILP